uniref:Uncharacterized protein n=1 Tax=Parascaris equorum TaxID=6256 RepID=A0A914R5M7_PAREQ
MGNLAAKGCQEKMLPTARVLLARVHTLVLFIVEKKKMETSEDLRNSLPD